MLLHIIPCSATIASYCAAMLLIASVCFGEKHDPARWEAAIAKMEEGDSSGPPPNGANLFVGSSSIRMWDLQRWFPNHKAINRGFGGSHVADSVHFAERIILPHHPRVVVVYAGDNDIAAGKSPNQVCSDFALLADKIHAALPDCHIVFISIKPSLKRWELVDQMRDANRQIQALISEDKQMTYVDIDTPMLGEDGRPRKQLFVKDGLHLSKAGYKVWSDLVRPHLAD